MAGGVLIVRVVAGLLALASVIALWFGVFWAAFGLAVETPNPSIPDGDPCCGHPDTWTDVVVGFAYGAMLLVGCAALGHIAFRLAHFALRGTRPSQSQTRRVALAAVCVAGTLALVVAPLALAVVCSALIAGTAIMASATPGFVPARTACSGSGNSE